MIRGISWQGKTEILFSFPILYGQLSSSCFFLSQIYLLVIDSQFIITYPIKIKSCIFHIQCILPQTSYSSIAPQGTHSILGASSHTFPLLSLSLTQA